MILLGKVSTECKIKAFGKPWDGIKSVGACNGEICRLEMADTNDPDYVPICSTAGHPSSL